VTSAFSGPPYMIAKGFLVQGGRWYRVKRLSSVVRGWPMFDYSEDDLRLYDK